jgi:hypothetical protein
MHFGAPDNELSNFEASGPTLNPVNRKFAGIMIGFFERMRPTLAS